MWKHNHLIKSAKFWKRKIKKYLQSYGIEIKVTGCQVIPDLRRFIYEVKPKKGTKIKEIFNRAEDVQTALGLHLLYVYRDGISIKIAVSEHEIKENKLLKILSSPLFLKSDAEIPLALGYDMMGNMHVADLTKLLHLLIVGPTGSGKSIAIKCLLLSVLVRCPITKVRLTVFEIGSESLSQFNDALHLYHPIVKDIETGVLVLESHVVEMDRRYALGEEVCGSLEHLILAIDEFDDMIAKIDDRDTATRFTNALNSLIRRGRKVKIILILASHDPTLKTAKANVNGIESRIAFRMLKHQNSSAALGVPGAEKLPGEGAMLFKSPKGITFLQGAFVTEDEIDEILSTKPQGHDTLDMLKLVEPEAAHLPLVDDEAVSRGIATENENKELAKIIMWVLGREKVSASKMEKLFKMGKRSDVVLDKLHKMNLVTEKFSKQPRSVIPKCYDDLSDEVVNLLNRYGYTEEQVKEVFLSKGERQSISDN